jgi:hypothetical protein
MADVDEGVTGLQAWTLCRWWRRNGSCDISWWMPHGLNKIEEEGAWSVGVQEEVTGNERDTWQGRENDELCHVDGEREVG